MTYQSNEIFTFNFNLWMENVNLIEKDFFLIVKKFDSEKNSIIKKPMIKKLIIKKIL